MSVSCHDSGVYTHGECPGKFTRVGVDYSCSGALSFANRYATWVYIKKPQHGRPGRYERSDATQALQRRSYSTLGLGKDC